MSEDRVVPLFGEPEHGKPNQDIISDLRFLLARAERGELKVLVYATVDGSDIALTGWTGDRGTQLSVIAAASRLQHAIMAE